MPELHNIKWKDNHRAGFIESWGRGIEKTCQACIADGSPIPEYNIHPGDIMIKFTTTLDCLVRSVSTKGTEELSL